MADFFKNTTPAPTDLQAIIVGAFKYNLQIAPDIFLTTICLFALLLQSPAFTALGGSLLTLTLVQTLLGRAFREIIPDTWKAPNQLDSTGMFPGMLPERISLLGTDPKEGYSIPSYYTMFVGFLLGWMGPLQSVYAQELSSSPQRALASILSLSFLCLFSVIALLYRFLASQDTFFGIVVGVVSGGLLGAGIMYMISYLTARRATNIYNLPLIGNVDSASKPIYMCKSN